MSRRIYQVSWYDNELGPQQAFYLKAAEAREAKKEIEERYSEAQEADEHGYGAFTPYDPQCVVEAADLPAGLQGAPLVLWALKRWSD